MIFSRSRVVLRMLLSILSLLMVLAPLAQAGWVEDKDGRTVIHLKLWAMPNPTRMDTAAKADTAVFDEFIRQFPAIFARKYRDKYKANAKKYGRHAWNPVAIELHPFTGITIAGMGMDSKILMAIAGGMAPDIMYVNFRASDTYIKQGFLYPLDIPADHYFSAMSAEEKRFRIHEKIWPIIRRKGPDGKEHIWAMPMGGVLGKVVLYRKDLLDAYGVPYPKNDWTWDDMMAICRKVTDPQKGNYGILMRRGVSESYYWVMYLWSAGGDVLTYDDKTDQWQAVFNSPAGVKALDFYTRLWTEVWRDQNDRKRYGYVNADTGSTGGKWGLGQVAFMSGYIDEKTFSKINPDLVGMVPVPLGPDGQRGAELNSMMQGIFAGIESPAVRDAAWEYLLFCDSREAVAIRTKVMVEGGLGRFVNPKYLRMFGYEDIIRLSPKGWEECFNIAIETGKPEPYGRNCHLVYGMMTQPLEKARQLAYDGKLPEDEPARSAMLQALLDNAVNETNEKMIGYISPQQRLLRRLSAVFMLICIGVMFTFVFRKIAKVFTPPDTGIPGRTGAWNFRKYAWAYLILAPALLSILLWQYLPLALGSKLAFQDYRIMGGSQWVGVDNFGNVLWDVEWWKAFWNSIRYSLMVIGLTFLPPVILAVLLQEIPRGRLLFRILFYLPAVITGLVVIYLWKSFYEPSEFGVLNAVVMKIPAIGYLLMGALFFMILFFFAKRLFLHQSYSVAGVCLVVGGILFYTCFDFAWPMLSMEGVPWYRALFMTMAEPSRWLIDPKTAMVCCVLPTIWAGMGPGCLIYLAALKGVSDDFYEAADIDGATFIDKILFVVIPVLKPLLIIQFVGIFVASWKASANIMVMTGGSSDTTVAGLHIFYQAYMYLKFGPAIAMAWVLGFMLIGFTVHQLKILSRLEFKTTGDK